MTGMTRRAFIRDFGHGTLGVVILGFGVVACSSDDDAGTTVDPGTTTATTLAGATTTSALSTTSTPTSTTENAEAEAVVWGRASLGGVSAYVLVRRGEAAVVDTGNPGTADAIEAALADVGVAWTDVSDVILTHLHNDHVGSLGDVMASAPDAIGYAGEPDLSSISSPRALTPVGDGDTVFGLDIIATPGHTPGSISIFDPVGGLLVVGDALRGVDGIVSGASPQFSSDMNAANESVRKLAELQFDTLLVGHTDPVIGGASDQVVSLAAGL